MIPTGRQWLILIPFYIVLAIAWAVYTLWIEPDVSRFEIGLVALAFLFAFARTIRRYDDRIVTPPAPEDPAWARSVNLASVAIASAFLLVTVVTGTVHDYILHLTFWSVVLDGGDPWYLERGFWGIQPPNAYGPLFNLLSVLTLVNRLAPKLLFATCYIAAATALTKELLGRRPASRLAAIGVMVWAWNPYAWIEVAIRGHFDVLVGLASVLAVHARRQGRDVPCAAALSFGVLLKYIPIVLLPFIALDRGRLRFKLIAITAGMIALGLGLSRLVWGASTFGPLRFAATRSSTYLSIFRFLRGCYSPLPGLGLEPDAEWLALPVLAAALGGAWWWCRSRRADPATAAVLSALVTLVLYRNGFPQYQIVLMMLASYWIIRTWPRRRNRTALVAAMLGYFGWINAFAVTYFLIGDGSPRFEDAVGLPTFVLGCALGLCIARSEPGFPAD